MKSIQYSDRDEAMDGRSMHVKSAASKQIHVLCVYENFHVLSLCDVQSFAT